MENRTQSRLPAGFLVFSITIGALLVVACGALITVEYDEAWIMASLQRKLDPTALPVVNNVMTTGGVHHLVIGAIGALGLPVIWVGRVFSALCLLALMVLINHRAADWGLNGLQRLFILAMALAAPGTAFLAGMAFGVVPAMLLFVLGLMIWSGEDAVPSSRQILLTGLCLGLAAATRWTFLPLLPALVLFALLAGAPRWPALKAAVLATIIAAVVFVIGFALHLWTAPPEMAPSEETIERSTRAAGLVLSLPAPGRVLAFLTKYGTLVPLPLAFGALALAWANLIEMPASMRRFLQLGVLCAVLVAVAWILRSPFQHVRYIWPSAFLVFIVAGFGLALFHDRLRQAGHGAVATLLLLVPLGFAAESYVTALRLVAVGAAMEINNGGQANLESHYRPFRLIREQGLIVDHLESQIAADDTVLALAIPPEFAHMQLSLLSGRNLVPLKSWEESGAVPDHIMIHDFSSLNQAGLDWLELHTEKTAEVMGYTFFRPRAVGFELPQEGDFALPEQLYRYSSPNRHSLTSF